jgi:hypothetical protein
VLLRRLCISPYVRRTWYLAFFCPAASPDKVTSWRVPHINGPKHGVTDFLGPRWIVIRTLLSLYSSACPFFMLEPYITAHFLATPSVTAS